MTTAVQRYGEVFTRRWVVEMMLDLAKYTSDQPLYRLVVVEPSVGCGAFVGPIVERLIASLGPSTSWSDLAGCLRGFDILAHHVETSRALAADLLRAAGCPTATAQVLARGWIQQGDFLLSTKRDLLTAAEQIEADLVVGNPPYIRIEDLPPHLLREYRRVAPTMGGRADIFVGFYEHGLDLLKPGGRLAYICADRWMRNSYGKALRTKIVREGISVDDVIVMHDAPAFDAPVSAYPAVTVLRRGLEQGTMSATATERFDGPAATRLVQWKSSDAPTLHTPSVKAARMERWHATGDVWPDGDPETLAWLADLAVRFPTVEDPQGKTRIGIGIATGADAVYIPQEAPDVEPGQLVPMAMAADIKSGEFRWSGRHLVSPWNSHGPVDLSEMPKLNRYFSRHQATLLGRNVASRSANWHRTIDRLNEDLLRRDLIVMADMTARAHPVRVPAGFYPHHNLTWISSTEWDLDVLGGLLMSEFVERQVAAHCVKMRGGTLRFQPTVLRRVRLPSPSAIRSIADELGTAFRNRDVQLATSLVKAAVGYALA